jgi:hypothetical protein
MTNVPDIVSAISTHAAMAKRMKRGRYARSYRRMRGGGGHGSFCGHHGGGYG